MTELNHTPGPWKLDKAFSDCVYCDDATGSIVARVAGAGFEWARRPTDEVMANASLIASAPAMYKTLVAAWTTLTDWKPEARSAFGLEIIYTDLCAVLDQIEAKP